MEWAQRFPGHISCLSKVIQKVRQGCLELHPVGAWKPPRTDTAQPLWMVPSCPHREYVSSHDFPSSFCLFSLFFLVITTLKSLVNLLVGTGRYCWVPWSYLCCRTNKPSSPSFFWKGKWSSPHHLDEFPWILLSFLISSLVGLKLDYLSICPFME